MKKVVLLGDSIRMSYGPTVAKLLGEEFSVWEPDDNCRYAQYTFQNLWEKHWADNVKDCDIIHWNNGLWDVCNLYNDGVFTPIEFYVQTMVRIAKHLQECSKTVIYATSTPVRKTNPNIQESDVERFNKAIVPELEKLGIVINDLHSLIAADIPRYISPVDHIHLTDEGVALCASQVEKVIREQAALL